MGGAGEPKEKEVERLLTQLRESPIDNAGASERVLGTAYDYLVESSTGKSLHWFCAQASSTVVIEAATFLLRLFAYNSSKVEKWKQNMDMCLFNCAHCVLGLERAKLESRTTYFGSFTPSVLDNFWASFCQWELQSVLARLSALGLNPDTTEPTSPIPPTVAYRMVTNMVLFQDEQIQSILHNTIPSEHFPSWPKDPIPPGILALLVDDNPGVRKWAATQSSQATIIPIANNVLVSHYRKVATSVASRDSSSGQSALRFPPIQDPVTFWKCFHDFIRFIHPDYLVSNSNDDIRHFVIRHLHDSGPELEGILRCLILILKRAGSRLWVGEGPEYPQVVFDALKDNPSFVDLLREGSSTAPDRPPWSLIWFSEFLDSVRDLSVYPEVFAKLAEFMCEELQHERFGDSRPAFAMYIAKFFLHQYKKAPKVASDLLDIHADTFAVFLFSRSHSKPTWSAARQATRELLEYTLARDSESIEKGIDQLCRWLAYLGLNKKLPKVDDESAKVSIRKQLWEKMYKSFQPQDLDGLRSIISVVSRASHLDLMVETGFKPILSLPQAKDLFLGINESLTFLRSGFKDVITAFVDHNVSTAALDLLKREGVVRDVIKLTLSPIDDLRNAGQTLVGHAFDADIRVECYRSLLQNFPSPTFDGFFEHLSTFKSYATTATEACSLSKWLVRCFTDILDVLCANTHGLLHKSQFLNGSHSSPEDGPASHLVKLWSAMCKTIQTIYKRTPSWSPYFTPEEMTEWMRDAIIFLRDLLDYRKVIEQAASASQGSGKEGKPGAIRKKMVQDLQDCFPEVIRWLRVTDMEILHQSYHLTQSLLNCFKETGMPPPSDSLKKVEGIIKVARQGDPNRGSRLDNARLATLEEAIGQFDEDEEDGIEFVSIKKAEKTLDKPKDVKARKVKEETPPQPSSSSSKPTKPAASKPPAKLPVKPPVPPPKPTKQALKGFSATDEEKLLAAHKPPAFKKTIKQQGEVKSREASKSVPSSDSDDSSDEEDEGEESQKTTLAQMAKFQKSPKIKKQPERRQIMQIDIPMERNPVAERIRAREEARRTTMRLRPDVSGLHKELLSWSYDHAGPYPPGRKFSLFKVPSQFSNFDHYRRVFEPLLLLECWNQLLQSKEEKLDFYEAKLDGRQYAGEFSDIDMTLSGPSRKDWFLTENDVILLRSSDGKTSVLGKTMSYRTLPTEAQLSVRCFVKPPEDPLQLNTTWQIAKVLSLSTLHREFGALVAVEAYDCAQQILAPGLTPIPKIDSKTVDQTMERYRVNEPQAIAITASMKTQGFSLIQGPPGTGKTSTICGLVAACLSSGGAPVTITAGKAPQKPASPKILICAPSNAAIDEIVGRLKGGVRGLTRKDGPLKVVRIGAEKAINVNVKEVSLDFLVDQKLNTFGAKPTGDIGSEVAALRQELESVKQLRQEKIQEVTGIQNNSARTQALDDEIKRLNSRRAALSQKLDSLRDKQKAETRTMDASRRKARQEVMQEADVICSTLSGSGHDTLEAFDFEMIVIDEAAQAVELSSLIPLKFKSTRCIMVGDPQQLPPTVLSQEACKYHYNQSLFVRLQKQRPDAVHLLSIQYRMHPDISRLPSKVFYDGKLKDGPSMEVKTERPWHSNGKFGTYRFFNVAKGLEEKSGQSLRNKTECQVAIALFSRLKRDFTRVDFTMKIGVVSMYRAQVVEIRNAFQQRFGRDIVSEVDFNTVDGFQGQEKDIIILSCVRAGPGVTNVGFLADIRRMNVAITRAKSSLFILGNAPTLERSNDVWRDIVQDARARNMLTDADEAYFTKITSNDNAPPPQSRPKSKRSLPAVPDPAIPADLVTPQQLKASQEKRRLSMDKVEHQDNPDGANPPQSKKPRVDDGPAPGPSTNPISQPIPAPSAASTSNPLPPRPQPVPHKRPKQQPNIFLPKQKNKRPADTNAGAGPPSNRRRF